MCITIKAERVIEESPYGVRSKEMGKKIKSWKVLKVKALDMKKLPRMYFTQRPHFYMRTRTNGKSVLVIYRNPKGLCYLEEGHVYSHRYFTKLLKIIKQAGNRLHKLNSWEGSKTFKI